MKTSKPFQKGIFIFRRDLRLVDNLGLIQTMKMCEHVIPLFIFTPEQILHQKNPFFSCRAARFMIESLMDLDKEIRKISDGGLITLYGDNVDCLRSFIREHEDDIDYIGFNADITPYAKKRDSAIADMCSRLDNVHCEMTDGDYYLTLPLFSPSTSSSSSSSSEPYKKFTPFYEKCLQNGSDEFIDSLKPKVIRKQTFEAAFGSSNRDEKKHRHQISLVEAFERFLDLAAEDDVEYDTKGGRTQAIKQLRKSLRKQLAGNFYVDNHNILAEETTGLSPYIKFGCLSIREVYQAFHTGGTGASREAIIRQLYWRDFYAQILFHYPHVLGHSMKPSYDQIRWKTNKDHYKAWTEGKTGFPVVDAGMRQLNMTGRMHNRARLICANFLVKTLLIDWRLGEKYFARKLIDYDVASNNGNWQWIASTGADSTPYFRTFNPWLQQKNFDPDCHYIRRWIKEVSDLDCRAIHQLSNVKVEVDYPKPIVDYSVQKRLAMDIYEAALKK